MAGLVGHTLGHHRIVEKIGAGGMGEVYRARDERLDRDVAIKVLPQELAQDVDRLARFEREAKLLASLSHQNIATLHGFEEHKGRRFLVMELAEGETLAERIAKGRIPVDDALEITRQLAEGLEAAHEQGIIHRDLKPANVMLSPQGRVKILDFGLAKAWHTEEREADLAHSPTLTAHLTAAGVILGTVAYMSPEQARGRQVDRRTDIWSLAVVLLECLTGANPFARNTVGDSIAAILTAEPNLDRLPVGVPAVVRETLKRCLRKDPRLRMRDAGDVRLMLTDATQNETANDSSVVTAATLTEGRLRVTDEMCRTLDRDGFDATLLGWEMRYADNNRESDVLVLWIPSIGGDHTTSAWRDLIAAAPYRMVVICPVGMEPGVANRPVVSLDNQFALIRSLTAHLRHHLRPRCTVITGFACGSVMALRCAAGDASGGLFDGVLAIDPDLQESDCFVTRLFASLDASSSEKVMEVLHEISGSCETTHEWLVLHQHMIECVDKMKTDFSPLIQQGRDLSAPFEGVHTGAASPFVGYLRDAIEHTGVVRCVFHDSAKNRRVVGEIRMMHLDNQCLGPGFSDDSLVFVPVTDHVGMMRNERLLDYLESIVGAVERVRT
jgi:serine/threonine protein kinase